MNKTIQAVTDRIIARSQVSRAAYLAKIEEPESKDHLEASCRAVIWRMDLPPAVRKIKPICVV